MLNTLNIRDRIKIINAGDNLSCNGMIGMVIAHNCIGIHRCVCYGLDESEPHIKVRLENREIWRIGLDSEYELVGSENNKQL